MGLVGQDGPTHNGVFDIAYLRTLPNMVLAAPRDATDMQRMLEMALRHEGPVAIRYPRASAPGVEKIHASERREMQPGKAETLQEGPAGGVVVWAYGALVEVALEASERLQELGARIGVVDARYGKPLDGVDLVEHGEPDAEDGGSGAHHRCANSSAQPIRPSITRGRPSKRGWPAGQTG